MLLTIPLMMPEPAVHSLMKTVTVGITIPENTTMVLLRQSEMYNIFPFEVSQKLKQ